MIGRPILAPDPCPEWLFIADIANHCHVAQSTASSWISRGNLTVVREPGSSGRYLVYGPSFVAWIEREHPTTRGSARPSPFARAPKPAAQVPVIAVPSLAPQDDYAAELRAIGLMFARWRVPYPVAWPAWVGPFPALEAS